MLTTIAGPDTVEAVDPRTPVIVGIAQLSDRGGANEPVELMHRAAQQAIGDAGSRLRNRVQSIRVVKGIWPYRDPGSLLADRLGISGVETGLTSIGGNEALDLLDRTAAEIVGSDLDVALICGAETMRTRRRDRAAGRRSSYLDEPERAAPTRTFGSDERFWDDADHRAGTDHAVNFYAMAASGVRHRLGLSLDDYRDRIAALWASAAAVAAANPHAWIRHAPPALEIATPSKTNRMVAMPYTKLMTSNIDVDQAAAFVVCSADAARSSGIPTDRWVFPYAGSGGCDVLTTRARWSLDGSPALRIAGRRALELAGWEVGEIDLLDLYSCFPAAVQVAQRELGLDPDRPFTITGGMTFAGGPFNTYCMHAGARAVELLREREQARALLSGNGGFFTKHSFLALGSDPPPTPFRYDRPQAQIDAEPTRGVLDEPPATGVLDAATVVFDRRGSADRAIVSVLDGAGRRAWATSRHPDLVDRLLGGDDVETPVDRTLLA